MKTDRIFRQRYNSQFQLQATYPKGHMNGFLVSFNPQSLLEEYLSPRGGGNDVLVLVSQLKALKQSLENSILRVKYHDSKTTHVLVSSIPFKYFIDIADLNHGETGYVKLTQFITDLDKFIGETVEQEAAYNFVNGLLRTNSRLLPFVSTYIDLGSIICDNGDELHIELDNNTGVDLPIGEVGVYAYSSDQEPFHINLYDLDADKNELHDQVVSSYVVNDSLEPAPDFEIEVRGTNETYTTDRTALVSMASLFNKVEYVTFNRTLPVFQGTEDLPEDVQIRIVSRNGGSLADLSVLNMRTESDVNKYVSQKQRLSRNLNEILTQASKSSKSSALVDVVSAEANS